MANDDVPRYGSWPPPETGPGDWSGTVPGGQGDLSHRPSVAPSGYEAYPGIRVDERESEKSFVVTWVLAWFLGVFGIDRFYLGKTTSAVFKLLTLGGCGVWALIDLILVLSGVAKDRYGRRLNGYRRFRVMAWVVTIVVTVLGIVTNHADSSDDDQVSFSVSSPAAAAAAAAHVA